MRGSGVEILELKKEHINLIILDTNRRSCLLKTFWAFRPGMFTSGTNTQKASGTNAIGISHAVF
ncbi:hypothetical protein LNTAR_11906 [Lentisphaera araneosa HTCC2155]|uniref:Uncharacterized protein n=1 Tax=Lentisphaera araneosa HTCC2155 TaxID=313628 RepID=A6DJI2_9BACT|nr:hypothetical protein LNTAR_11906 [Lentisphaera araneosa HTCC2155]